MGSESIGIHFRGKSTEGKTTLLRVGYSPFHGPEKLPSWRATVNALEGIAKAHCDGLLVLDELGMIQPGQAGEAAYMLQNGVGKTRANKLGDPRKSAEWRMIYLSSGEISLAAHLNDGGKQIKAGQEVRLVEVPADAGAGMGAFENIHGAESPAAFAQYLNHSALQSYGEPALAFLGNLVQDQSMAREKALGYSKQFLDGLDLADASGQVQRVARMFALVAAAGELATEYEITGWEPGQAMAGISTCLHAWIDDRGGTNQSEETRMLEQVEGFISQNDQRFSTGALKRAGWIITGADDESAESDTLSRLYCVFPEVFRTEICKGFDPKQVARSLLARGILIAGSKGEPTSNRRHPLTRKQSRCYVIDAVKLLGAGIEEPESLEDLRVIA